MVFNIRSGMGRECEEIFQGLKEEIASPDSQTPVIHLEPQITPWFFMESAEFSALISVFQLAVVLWIKICIKLLLALSQF